MTLVEYIEEIDRIDKAAAGPPAKAPPPPEKTPPSDVSASPSVAPAPKPVHGALNPAYTTTATNDDVFNEMAHIKGRVEARTGTPANASGALATFQRNLERKVRATIIAAAVKKYGKIPSTASVDATYAVWSTRWLAAFMAVAQRELRAHNHPAHAAGLAHEKTLAQMHVDQIARTQEQRTGMADQRVATTDRRQSKAFKVKYNRRTTDGEDRRQGDRRAATAEKVEVIVEHDWAGKYEEPTFVATSVADLVKGKIRYKGDLTNIVYRYLLRSYPEKVVGWVKDGDWEYDPHVKLSDINMARRPGGRDPSKVASISKTLSDGASLDPIVLVDDHNPNGLEIADGWHRTLGAEDAKLDDVPAFIGTGFGHQLGLSAPWGMEMQDESDSKKKAEFAELAAFRRFIRKASPDGTPNAPENFRTTAIRPDVLADLVEDVKVMGHDVALERARLRLEGVYFEPSKKDFSLSSPLSSGLVPYGLDQAPSPGNAPSPDVCDVCGAALVPGRDGEGRDCPNGHGMSSFKYSDDQARDERGRWEGGSGMPVHDGTERLDAISGSDVTLRSFTGSNDGPSFHGDLYLHSDDQVKAVVPKGSHGAIGYVKAGQTGVNEGRIRVGSVGVYNSYDHNGKQLGTSSSQGNARYAVIARWNDHLGKAEAADTTPVVPDLALLAAIDAELDRRGIDVGKLNAAGQKIGWEYVEEGEKTKKGKYPDGLPGQGIPGVERDGVRYGVTVGRDDDGVFVTTHRARSKSYPTLDDIPKSALEFVDESG